MKGSKSLFLFALTRPIRQRHPRLQRERGAPTLSGEGQANSWFPPLLVHQSQSSFESKASRITAANGRGAPDPNTVDISISINMFVTLVTDKEE